MCKFNNNKHRIYLDELLGPHWDLTGHDDLQYIYMYVCIYMYDHILYIFLKYYIYIWCYKHIYLYIHRWCCVYIYINTQKCNICVHI
jgi:hypothetical protein